MTYDRIMLIRHGERPNDTDYGVDRNGNRDEDELAVRGWQRAGALARLFAPGTIANDDSIAVPTKLFAVRPDTHHPSKRSKHTLAPLAHVLGLDIDLSFGRGEEAALGHALRAHPGLVLVAWEHRAIGEIVREATGGAVVPPDWPDDRFDMIYILESRAGWKLHQRPQMLLGGDSAAKF